jgi:hypothetical protein
MEWMQKKRNPDLRDSLGFERFRIYFLDDKTILLLNFTLNRWSLL